MLNSRFKDGSTLFYLGVSIFYIVVLYLLVMITIYSHWSVTLLFIILLSIIQLLGLRILESIDLNAKLLDMLVLVVAEIIKDVENDKKSKFLLPPDLEKLKKIN